MNISGNKRDALYDAIHDPIMDIRVKVGIARKDGKLLTIEEIDELLFSLPTEVWERQKEVLSIKD